MQGELANAIVGYECTSYLVSQTKSHSGLQNTLEITLMILLLAFYALCFSVLISFDQVVLDLWITLTMEHTSSTASV